MQLEICNRLSCTLDLTHLNLPHCCSKGCSIHLLGHWRIFSLDFIIKLSIFWMFQLYWNVVEYSFKCIPTILENYFSTHKKRLGKLFLTLLFIMHSNLLSVVYLPILVRNFYYKTIFKNCSYYKDDRYIPRSITCYGVAWCILYYLNCNIWNVLQDDGIGKLSPDWILSAWTRSKRRTIV